MERIYEMIADARAKKASDIHISEGLPVWYRINGRLLPAEVQLQESGIRGMLEALLDEKHRAAFERGEDADFSLTTPEGYRQRVNVFRQQKKLATRRVRKRKMRQTIIATQQTQKNPAV